MAQADGIGLTFGAKCFGEECPRPVEFRGLRRSEDEVETGEPAEQIFVLAEVREIGK